MTQMSQIYKCDLCGNIVEMIHAGVGELVCCGQLMTVQNEKSGEEGTEKHKPVVEGSKVKVGSIPHPMEEGHYIEWVEVLEGDDICRKTLKPGQQPEAQFCQEDIKKVRAYCNVHGLWTN